MPPQNFAGRMDGPYWLGKVCSLGVLVMFGKKIVIDGKQYREGSRRAMYAAKNYYDRTMLSHLIDDLNIRSQPKKCSICETIGIQ